MASTEIDEIDDDIPCLLFTLLERTKETLRVASDSNRAFLISALVKYFKQHQADRDVSLDELLQARNTKKRKLIAQWNPLEDTYVVEISEITNTGFVMHVQPNANGLAYTQQQYVFASIQTLQQLELGTLSLDSLTHRMVELCCKDPSYGELFNDLLGNIPWFQELKY